MWLCKIFTHASRWIFNSFSDLLYGCIRRCYTHVFSRRNISKLKKKKHITTVLHDLFDYLMVIACNVIAIYIWKITENTSARTTNLWTLNYLRYVVYNTVYIQLPCVSFFLYFYRRTLGQQRGDAAYRTHSSNGELAALVSF